MTNRPTIDVSALPTGAWDSRSPAWWGNALFMAIETSTVCLMLASYFYLWRNYPQTDWPPPRTDTEPAILRPLPELLLGTINVVLLLLTVPLMWWTDQQCRKQFDRLEALNVSKPEEAPEGERPPVRPAKVFIGLGVFLVLGIVICVIRWKEFPGLLVQWNENAYAGLVWTLLGLHFTYVVIEVVEAAVLLVWGAIYGVGENHCGDVVLTIYYWYWTVGVGVVVYAVVYLFPRVA